MKKSFLYGVMALGLIFTACQSDDIPENSGEISTDSERTFYVNMNIRGDVDGIGSRAAVEDGNPVVDPNNDVNDFADGESDVTKAYFVFYDKTGNVIGNEPVEINLNNVTWETGDEGTVDKYYKSIVGVTVSNGQENPSQVVCYLNTPDKDNLSLPLSQIQEKTRDLLYTESDKKYFLMSNSVFYTTTEADAPQIAVQIAPNQLFNTRKAAEDAQNNSALAVNIYVERYAAKLKFKTTTPNDYETISRNINSGAETAVSLKFVPNTWMLNASCQDTYVVKSFREESPTGNILADNYGYQELNEVINRTVEGQPGNWNWNAKNYNRSYWGMSPAYFTAEYPEVSSDVQKISTLNQHYYSYNELINGINGNDPVGYTLPSTGSDVTEYVHETTVGSKALNSKNVVAAFPSVILVGDYTVNIGAQDYTGIDFYTYSVISNENQKPLVYFDYKTEDGSSKIVGGESILYGLMQAATDLYKIENDKYVNFDLSNTADVQKLVAVLTVEEPSSDVKGALKIPERYRTLQFNENASAAELEGIYIATAEGYNTIATANVSTPAAKQITLIQANQELMNVVGFCAKYNAGAAYFNIPVKHYGWYRTGNVNKDKEEINWSKVRVGDFGIVRNHSYTVDVTEILGLGTGIGGKDSPIVPPAEENRYYIAYSVNILKWAVVPTQKVEL